MLKKFTHNLQEIGITFHLLVRFVFVLFYLFFLEERKSNEFQPQNAPHTTPNNNVVVGRKLISIEIHFAADQHRHCPSKLTVHHESPYRDYCDSNALTSIWALSTYAPKSIQFNRNHSDSDLSNLWHPWKRYGQLREIYLLLCRTC